MTIHKSEIKTKRPSFKKKEKLNEQEIQLFNEAEQYIDLFLLKNKHLYHLNGWINIYLGEHSLNDKIKSALIELYEDAGWNATFISNVSLQLI